MRYVQRGTVIFAFTAKGCELAGKIKDKLLKQREQERSEGTIELWITEKLAERVLEGSMLQQKDAESGMVICKEPLSKWLAKNWNDYERMIFVSATGIAVRMIAPFLKDKRTDPAVVVLDECGTYSISLVSGHLGGANELAAFLAEAVGAIPVITTATDVEQQFAVDLFAKKNGLKILNLSLAKEVTAELLHGGKIGFYSEKPIEGKLPKGLVRVEDREELKAFSYGIEISAERKKKSWDSCSVLQLLPRDLVLGIGCRKGMTAEALLAAAKTAEQSGIFSIAEIGMIASIDLKAKEQGILELAALWQVPFLTFSAEELSQVTEVSKESEFVQNIAGVGNVCERAAILGAQVRTAEIKKQKYCGITFAAARKKGSIRFE